MSLGCHIVLPIIYMALSWYSLFMNSQSILVRTFGSDESWVEPQTASYNNEAHLQELLASDPNRIPGIPNGAVAVRELVTSAGPVDVCVIDQFGEITVVECKLERNSEKRRMVIGQVIDYASAIRDDGVEQFLSAWRSRGGQDIDSFFIDGSYKTFETNIEEGNINLCLAVDRIDNDLRRLVEFLNAISRESISVTALQLTYARHNSLEILIPETFGAEIASQKSRRRLANRDPWTWEDFVGQLSSPQDKAIAHNLLERLNDVKSKGNHDQLEFGSRPRGSIYFHIHGERFAPFQIWQNSAHQLIIFGTWRVWSQIKNDERFSDLAVFLGQSHLGSASGVPANSIDLDEFWRHAVQCDAAINNLG